ncbi:MAG: PmbA/TldA family metallopeptidase, partial [Planctomycetota bacterium]
MQDLASYARDCLSSLNVSYGDARLVETRTETVELENGAPRAVTSAVSRGIGVRVVYNGSWGFAATSTLNKRSVGKACREAVRIARAGRAARGEGVALSPVEPVVAEYTTPFEEDPFKVSLEEKLTLLREADKGMSGERAVKIRRSTYRGFERKTTFASTEGALISQRIVQCGGGIAATAVGNDDAQVRSFPASFRGNFRSAGFEFFRSLGLAENAPQCAA